MPADALAHSYLIPLQSLCVSKACHCPSDGSQYWQHNHSICHQSLFIHPMHQSSVPSHHDNPSLPWRCTWFSAFRDWMTTFRKVGGLISMGKGNRQSASPRYLLTMDLCDVSNLDTNWTYTCSANFHCISTQRKSMVHNAGWKPYLLKCPWNRTNKVCAPIMIIII